MNAKKCAAWRREHRPSGASPWVRYCGQFRVEIVSGERHFTWNAYGPGGWLKRGSRKTLKDAKSTGTRYVTESNFKAFTRRMNG